MKKEEAIQIHMDRIGIDLKSATNDYTHQYLTINKGRDGVEYAWYQDEHISYAIDSTGKELTEEEEGNLLI